MSGVLIAVLNSLTWNLLRRVSQTMNNPHKPTSLNFKHLQLISIELATTPQQEKPGNRLRLKNLKACESLSSRLWSIRSKNTKIVLVRTTLTPVSGWKERGNLTKAWAQDLVEGVDISEFGGVRLGVKGTSRNIWSTWSRAIRWLNSYRKRDTYKH